PFVETKKQEWTPDQSLVMKSGWTRPTAGSKSNPNARRKRRVLIVDDEPTVRKCVKLSLVSEGIECDEAENGSVALQCLDRETYDLVLTDIEMPVLSGLELLGAIKNRSGLGNIKVLVFSGRSSPNEMAHMM